MVMKTAMLTILLASILALPVITFAKDDDDSRDHKRRGDSEWKEEYWDGPCKVKIESKRGEYKREIKCKDGIGAWWQGEWKKEFWDGSCKVKQEAKYDEFKEEIKCDKD
jgi:hypothetical protein